MPEGASVPAIRCRGLGKQYRLGPRERYRTLRESLVDGFRAPWELVTRRRRGRRGELIWALRDIDLDITAGDVVGIIGRNGAGKTTLLKVLSRITEPTEGYAEVYGRIGSLLEVGTGFHPELSGRENIYLSGAVLGMRRAEIARKFDEIVDFASVAQFLDTPVKRYSSGMYVRLAFAVAAHLETEILLVDEVLAVGDAAFQLKCIGKMSEAASGGKTVLFVTHNMETVTKLCQRAVLMDDGRVTLTGTPEECVNHYLAGIRKTKLTEGTVMSLVRNAGRSEDHSGPVRLTGLALLNDDGVPSWDVRCGGRLSVVLSYDAAVGTSHNVMFAVTFSNIYNQRIATCRSNDASSEPVVVEGPGRARVTIPRVALRPGHYNLTVSVNTEAGYSDGIYDAAVFEVVGTDFYPTGTLPHPTQGSVLFDHTWKLNA